MLRVTSGFCRPAAARAEEASATRLTTRGRQPAWTVGGGNDEDVASLSAHDAMRSAEESQRRSRGREGEGEGRRRSDAQGGATATRAMTQTDQNEFLLQSRRVPSPEGATGMNRALTARGGKRTMQWPAGHGPVSLRGAEHPGTQTTHQKGMCGKGAGHRDQLGVAARVAQAAAPRSSNGSHPFSKPALASEGLPHC